MPQTQRRRQYQVGAVGFEQVCRTYVRSKAARNQSDHVGERFGGPAAVPHQSLDFLHRKNVHTFAGRGRRGVGFVVHRFPSQTPVPGHRSIAVPGT